MAQPCVVRRTITLYLQHGSAALRCVQLEMAVLSVPATTDAPTSFPDSEWGRFCGLLAGRAVDSSTALRRPHVLRSRWHWAQDTWSWNVDIDVLQSIAAFCSAAGAAGSHAGAAGSHAGAAGSHAGAAGSSARGVGVMQGLPGAFWLWYWSWVTL
jgi:hypothetical protein